MSSGDAQESAVAPLVADADRAANIAALHARIAGRFARAEPRRRALAYLQALLSPLPRKTGRQAALHAGEVLAHGMQRLLTNAAWDADAVRDDVRAYVVERLGAAGAILLVGDLGFPKKGRKSVGTIRQRNPTTGRIGNCQIGVFVAYRSRRGCAMLDRELYVPRAWLDQPASRAEAGIPPALEYATRSRLAQRMLERTLGAGVRAAWVTGAATYGRDGSLRRWLHLRKQPFVLAIAGGDDVWHPGPSGPAPIRAAELAASAPPQRWRADARVNPAPAARDRWLHLPLAGEGAPTWRHGLLVRRREGREEPDYFVTFAPATSALATLAEVVRQSADLDECLALAKGQVGLDQYEVRHWRGWYRHITLAMLAHAFLAASGVQAAQAGEDQPGAWQQLSFLADEGA